MVQVSSAAVTHPGLRREGNEDAFRARPDLGLFVVADGMGGHEAGEVASGLTVTMIESFINDTRDADLNQTWPFPYEVARSLEANRLIAAFRLANRRVASSISADPALKGMATTAAAVLLGPEGHLQVAHVGDSRVYLLRNSKLTQVTNDHSWVGEQVRAGLLTDTDAQRHPWRNVVTRAISGGDDPEVEVAEVAIETGDLIMICSDGLSSVVSLEAIQTILNNRTLDPGPVDPGPASAKATAGRPSALEATASALIDAANAGGGPDNITVVLVRVDVR